MTRDEMNELNVGDYIMIPYHANPTSLPTIVHSMAPMFDGVPRKILKLSGAHMKNVIIEIEGIFGGSWDWSRVIDMIVKVSPDSIYSYSNDSLIRIDVEREVDCIILGVV